MAVVTMKQLLDSGTHFGHQTRRWNPKMKRFIFTDRNGIYIIDLQQTLTFIDKAYEFVKETVAHGGSVLFVGTKKQAQESIADEAIRSAALLTKVIAAAVAEGLQARAGVGRGDGKPDAEGAEPLAEWEQELLASATATAAPAEQAAAVASETTPDPS